MYNGIKEGLQASLTTFLDMQEVDSKKFSHEGFSNDL